MNETSLNLPPLPLIAIINGGVRSGKEWVSSVLKEKRRAILIGETTSGHFLAGGLFKIVPGRFDLYLAVQKSSGPDLEGKGVSPDIEVRGTLPYSSGKDAQMEAALKIAASCTSDPTN